MSKETILGIDLGTGNSCVSIIENGEARILVNEEGQRTTPSIVSYDKNGDINVGSIAKRQATTNFKNTIFASKRLIGKQYSDLGSIEKSFPYLVKANKNGDAVIEIDGKEITPQEVAAKILQKLKKSAETYLGHQVNKAVITVPAFFNSKEKDTTKVAGEIAGLEVLRVIPEPTAACLAFGLGKDKKGVYAVYDYGSGTFDLSIIDIDDDVFEVLSTNGDVFCGGTDLDNEIVQWMIAEFKKNEGVDLSLDNMAKQRLVDEAEKIKIELSSTQTATINIPFISATASGAKHLNMTLTRAQFERMCEVHINKTIECCRKALKDAGKDVKDITDVLLVGGSTRIPYVQQKVKEFFGKEPNRSLNPDEAVSLGAAIQGGIMSGDVEKALVLDTNPISFGVETFGGVFSVLIEKNTTIPTKKTQVFSTAQDSQSSVEVVIGQGERKFMKDNRIIGKFLLDGIAPAPRGVPQIEITYDIDSNGILSVSAKDLGTNKEHSITISNSSGLSQDEVSRMKKEAEQYEEEDKKKLEQLTIKNAADSLVYSAEKFVNENEAKIADDAKADLRLKTDDLKEKLKGDNFDDIKSAHQVLQQALYAGSEKLYQGSETKVVEEVVEGEVI